jgi:dGTPase
VALVNVMERPWATTRQSREREVIAELVAGFLDRAPIRLEPRLREDWAAAPNDSARLRVVIDQVASLTDTSAMAFHAEFTGKGRAEYV